MTATVTDHAEQVVDRFVDAFFGRHDAEAAARIYAEDAILWDPGEPDVVKGREAVRANLEGYLGAFPDFRGEITNLFGSADWGAAELTVRGTNTGPLETEPGVTIPPTGRSVELKVCWVFRATPDGLCAEDHTYYDNASLMAQLRLGEG